MLFLRGVGFCCGGEGGGGGGGGVWGAHGRRGTVRGDVSLVDHAWCILIRMVFKTVTSVQKGTTGLVMLVQGIQMLEDIPSLISRILR